MTDAPILDVYRQGYRAAQGGLHPADNPFPRGTAEYESWRIGWCDQIAGKQQEAA